MPRFKLSFKLPAIFRRAPKVRRPDTRPVGRTGDARYAVQIARRGINRDGDTVVLAHRLDSTSIPQLDRTRKNTIVKDGLNASRGPVTRAKFHFSCSRQDVADLAQLELGKWIPVLLKQLHKSGQEFGWGACAERWKPKFEVSISAGQQTNAPSTEKFFPFVWTIDRFAFFSPIDTMLRIDSTNGNFAGVRQYVYTANEQDVAGHQCILYTHNKEFDCNYGEPETLAAIPFVEGFDQVMDDMFLDSRRQGVPWTIIRYPRGRTPMGTDNQGNPLPPLENRDLAEQLGDDLLSGQTIAIPSSTNMAGVPEWAVDTKEADASRKDIFVGRVELLKDLIRLALVAPEMVSSSTPDSGTYNLGQSIIDLFLANVEGVLNEFESILNEQLVKRFVFFNFGPIPEECKLIFEPVDANFVKALLQSLVTFLGSGEPLQDADGNLMYVDYPKMLEDVGLPMLTVDPKQKASDIKGAIEEKLRSMAGGGKPSTEGESDDLGVTGQL